MRRIEKTRTGFTIVELSLSIAFIAILSIIVVVIISNAISSYHRGITMNQLNTIGMDIAGEMQTTVQASPARSLIRECSTTYTNSGKIKKCEDDSATSFAYVERYVDVEIGQDKGVTVPVYGAFCTGAYSYLWNSGYFFNEEYKVNRRVGALELSYRRAGNSEVKSATGFKLLKVHDENRLACKSGAGAVASDKIEGDYYPSNDHSNMSNVIDMTSVSIDEDPYDLLQGDNNLAIYDLTTATPAEGGTANMLYAVSFVLGTIQGGINVRVGGNYCATPEGYNSGVESFDYCAINKFNFAAQATGG